MSIEILTTHASQLAAASSALERTQDRLLRLQHRHGQEDFRVRRLMQLRTALSRRIAIFRTRLEGLTGRMAAKAAWNDGLVDERTRVASLPRILEILGGRDSTGIRRRRGEEALQCAQLAFDRAVMASLAVRAIHGPRVPAARVRQPVTRSRTRAPRRRAHRTAAARITAGAGDGDGPPPPPSSQALLAGGAT